MGYNFYFNQPWVQPSYLNDENEVPEMKRDYIFRTMTSHNV